jgi:protein-L-isoaspartate(D-aspartate) O-methyltransferase
MVLARMIQEARVASADRVLLVGAGTGYACAVLARIAVEVVGVEADRAFADRARSALGDLGATGVIVLDGPLRAGAPDRAPFDVVVIDGAVAAVPPSLLAQIGEGGRLVAVVAPQGRFGQALLYERRGGVVSPRALFDAGTPLLPGFEPVAGFQF